MKVEIRNTVDMDEAMARAVKAHYGEEFVSWRDSAATLRLFCRSNGDGALDDLEYETNMRAEGSVMS